MSKSKPHTSTDCTCQPCQTWERARCQGIDLHKEYPLSALTLPSKGQLSVDSVLKLSNIEPEGAPAHTGKAETALKWVGDLMADSRRRDAARRQMADEIVEAQNPKTLDEAKLFARNWIETAAQYADNEDYFRKERDKLQARLDELEARLKATYPTFIMISTES